MQGHPFLSYFLGEVIFYFKVPAKKLYMTSFVVNISTAIHKIRILPTKMFGHKGDSRKTKQGKFF